MRTSSIEGVPTAGRLATFGCIWFVFIDLRVFGFGRWDPSFILSSRIHERVGALRDAWDDFPTALNVPMIPKNASRTEPQSSPPTFIPPEKINYLQDSVDIISVIESYGLPRFKRSGLYRATCLCPFHNDHNPSMNIDSSKGIFKCFSCGAGGNVFTFVRHYTRLQGQVISFSQAVRLVDEQLASGNDKFALDLPPHLKSRSEGDSTVSYSNSSTSPASSHSKVKAKVFRTTERRILLANAVAAAFFENCLVSLPSAGKARNHLQSRGVSPRTVRAFAIGYAPDAYFSNNRNGATQKWGEGSLVQHLEEKGFSSTEIIDAGLATVTKKDSKNQKEQNDSEDLQIPYSSLIDRFRGRLVVPIFDFAGKHVLAFGGRALDSDSEISRTSGRYVGPKYLNSPDSSVFKKKTLLFGSHMAEKALRFWDKDDHIPRAVVVVEGYFDAIALWQAGVREAVACMGTGITTEQITAAAVLAGKKNGKIEMLEQHQSVRTVQLTIHFFSEGRVIFCLDNDDAGTAAVKRLCRSGILTAVEGTHPVEFRVAHLPKRVKDPSEYIETNRDESNAGDKFRVQILKDSSVEWKDWYQRHVMNEYNATASKDEKGSLAYILDELGDFLAKLQTGDSEMRWRTREIVNEVAAWIADENNKTVVEEVVRLQLEAVRDTQASARAKSVFSSPLNQRGSIDKMSQTLATMAPHNEPALSSGLRPLKKTGNANTIQGWQRSAYFDSTTGSGDERHSETGRRFPARTKDRKTRKEFSLTPHFSGFDFSSKHDREWLQDDEMLGKSQARSRREVTNGKEKDRQIHAVYFNSNDYHGKSFITESALSAGYTNDFVPRDPDLLAKGINSLVHLKSDSLLQSAENDLLRCLWNFPSTRMSLKQIINIGQLSEYQQNVSWTCHEKAWLFHRLTSGNLSMDLCGKEILAEFETTVSGTSEACIGELSNGTSLDSRSRNFDASGESGSFPDDAIESKAVAKRVSSFSRLGDEIGSDESHPTGGEIGRTIGSPSAEKLIGSSNGNLDFLFNSAEEGAPTLSEEEAKLLVQETYYTLLWASSIQILEQKQNEMAKVASELSVQEEMTRLSDSGEFENDQGQNLSAVGRTTAIESSYQLLGKEVRDASAHVSVFWSALRGLSSRMIQRSLAMESSLSSSQANEYSKLAARLTEHMADLESWSIAGTGNEDDDVPYETVLERTQMEWGDLYEDDHIWSEHDIARSSQQAADTVVSNDAEAENRVEEPIDMFMARLEQDWGWLEEPKNGTLINLEKPSFYDSDETEWDELFDSNVDR